MRGRLIEMGWGAAMGYPGIVLDETAQEVAVHLFTSPALARDGIVRASIYTLAQG